MRKDFFPQIELENFQACFNDEIVTDSYTALLELQPILRRGPPFANILKYILATIYDFFTN